MMVLIVNFQTFSHIVDDCVSTTQWLQEMQKSLTLHIFLFFKNLLQGKVAITKAKVGSFSCSFFAASM